MTAPLIRGRWTLWPCSHQGVLVEPSDVPPGYRCAECGASPVEVVPVPDDAAVERAARALYDLREHEGVRPPVSIWPPSDFEEADDYRLEVRAVLAAMFEARP
jgi:hypothetical protein